MIHVRIIRPEPVEWADRTKLETMPVHEFVAQFVK